VVTVRRTLLALPALALGVAMTACGAGAGPMTSQTRDVAPFDRLEVSDAVDVRVVRGDRVAVSVRAGEDVIGDLRTESSGGTLRVSAREEGIVIGPSAFDDASVVVTVPRLSRVDVNGSSDVDLRGAAGQDLAVSVDGSGDVDLGAAAGGLLDLSVHGSGDISASGRVERVLAEVEGSGNLDLERLAADSATVDLSGSGDVALGRLDTLDADVAGSGDVSYLGRPRVSSRVSGSGDVGAAD
jgi:hypothetical protein